MKLFQSYIYVVLSLFTVTILFSQNNSKSTSANNGKKNPIGAIIGGNNTICAGSKTQFTIANHPTHSGHIGKWSVSNRLVAAVNSDGVVTALQPGVFVLKYDFDDSNCKGDSHRTVVVKLIPKASVIGPTSICINGTTKVFPLLAGTWTSSNPAVATVNNLGIVKGISPGSATFTFTSLNGCPSEPTVPVTVSSGSNAEIVGSSSICINETTTLSPSTGGTWTSSNKGVATVTNSGVVKGISAGTATFTFTKTGGCASLPSQAVKVNANTAVRITGANVICVNGTTTLSPTSGGTWSSSNSSVATVSNAGIVTGIAAGKATFVFTKTDGCTSLPTSSITINTCPQAIITGPDNICVNGTTTLSPTTGGTWTSSNRAVATVTNAGIVKGISTGTVTFTYTKTGSCSSVPTPVLTVGNSAPARITGTNSICINGTTTLSPTTGGTWSSSNTSVATVSNDGIVTGIRAGRATFIFTKTGGCTSPATSAVTVNDCPVAAITGPSTICINGTTTLSPTTGGTWTSSNKTIATVTNSGVVKGISTGTAKFTFTKTGSCNSLATPAVTVTTAPKANITGSNSICVNATTTLSPTSGGTWSSSNPAVATVNNNGVVTGISAGTATFTFTVTGGGCVSAPTSAITINANPIVSAITGGSSIISIGSTTQFYNNTSGGVWSITNGTGSATITASGLVTGTGIGTVKINYIVENGYCKSEMVSQEITIKASTILPVITGPDIISISKPSTAFQNETTGGVWSIKNGSGTATITQGGIVQGTQAGTVEVVYTFVDAYGVTVTTSKEITIKAATVLPAITGPDTISISKPSTAFQNETAGGVWSVTNGSGAATITQGGIVQGTQAGTVEVVYTFVDAYGVTVTTSKEITIKAATVLPAITGPDTISISKPSTAFQNETAGGVWSVTNGSGAATITQGGIVQGTQAGTVEVVYTFVDAYGVTVTASKEITIKAATVLPAITGPDTISISKPSTAFQNETAGGVWSIKNGSGTATITQGGIVQGTQAGTVEVVYTFVDAYGVTVTTSKEITIKAATVLSAITGPDTVSVSLRSLPFQNETAGGVWSITNGTGVATITNEGVVEGTQAGTVEVVYTFVDSYGVTVTTSKEITIKAATVLPAITGPDTISISKPSTAFQNETAGGVWSIKNGTGAATITNEGVVEGIQAGTVEVVYTFVDSYGVTVTTNKEVTILSYTALQGKIIASIEKPTTLDTISFSFEPLTTTFTARKTSSQLAVSEKSTASSTLVNNLTYKWIFRELDNVTLKDTITDPIALQRFPIPGNYRLTLIITDQNGIETTFYRDVIVTQTCDPIIGKIKILN